MYEEEEDIDNLVKFEELIRIVATAIDENVNEANSELEILKKDNKLYFSYLAALVILNNIDETNIVISCLSAIKSSVSQKRFFRLNKITLKWMEESGIKKRDTIHKALVLSANNVEPSVRNLSGATIALVLKIEKANWEGIFESILSIASDDRGEEGQICVIGIMKEIFQLDTFEGASELPEEVCRFFGIMMDIILERGPLLEAAIDCLSNVGSSFRGLILEEQIGDFFEVFIPLLSEENPNIFGPALSILNTVILLYSEITDYVQGLLLQIYSPAFDNSNNLFITLSLLKSLLKDDKKIRRYEGAQTIRSAILEHIVDPVLACLAMHSSEDNGVDMFTQNLIEEPALDILIILIEEQQDLVFEKIKDFYLLMRESTEWTSAYAAILSLNALCAHRQPIFSEFLLEQLDTILSLFNYEVPRLSQYIYIFINSFIKKYPYVLNNIEYDNVIFQSIVKSISMPLGVAEQGILSMKTLVSCCGTDYLNTNSKAILDFINIEIELPIFSRTATPSFTYQIFIHRLPYNSNSELFNQEMERHLDLLETIIDKPDENDEILRSSKIIRAMALVQKMKNNIIPFVPKLFDILSKIAFDSRTPLEEICNCLSSVCVAIKERAIEYVEFINEVVKKGKESQSPTEMNCAIELIRCFIQNTNRESAEIFHEDIDQLIEMLNSDDEDPFEMHPNIIGVIASIIQVVGSGFDEDFIGNFSEIIADYSAVDFDGTNKNQYEYAKNLYINLCRGETAVIEAISDETRSQKIVYSQIKKTVFRIIHQIINMKLKDRFLVLEVCTLIEMSLIKMRGVMNILMQNQKIIVYISNRIFEYRDDHSVYNRLFETLKLIQTS